MPEPPDPSQPPPYEEETDFSPAESFLPDPGEAGTDNLPEEAAERPRPQPEPPPREMWRPTRRPGLPPDPPPPWAPLIIPKEGVPVPPYARRGPPRHPSRPPMPRPPQDADEDAGLETVPLDEPAGQPLEDEEGGPRPMPRPRMRPPMGRAPWEVDPELLAPQPKVPALTWILIAAVVLIVVGPNLWNRLTGAFRLRELDRRLCIAAAEGNAGVVRDLLEDGARPTALARLDGKKPGSPPLTLSALGWAVELDHAEVVEALLAAQADPNNVDSTLGLTALDRASSPRVARLLAQAGGRVSSAGDPSLIHAVLAGDVKKLATAAKTNPQVNAQDYQGRTALMWAAWLGRADMVRVLLSHKADRQVRTLDGTSAEEYARRGGSQEALKLLRAP